MERWHGKIAVVTGASSGIGKEAAIRFVELGLKVVGLARRVELVQELSEELSGKPGKLFALKCDVSDEDEVKKVFETIKQKIGLTSILINNAGISHKFSFIDGKPKDWKKVLDINLFGTSICAVEAIKQMRELDDSGHIININSIMGHKLIDYTQNTTNMYASSKHGVTAFTETLRQELRDRKSQIKVTSVSPGLVDTNIFKAGNITELNEETMKLMPHLLPEDVVDGIVYALSTRPHVQVHEIIIKPLGELF